MFFVRILRYSASSLIVISVGLIAVSSVIDLEKGFLDNRDRYRKEEGLEISARREAARQAAESCNIILKDGDTLQSCLARELQAYEDVANTNRDLLAQVDMAFWAKWLFWLTAIATAVGAGSLVFLWISLRQTRLAI